MSKIKEEWKQINGKYRCPECGKEYTKSGICSHIWRCHTDEGKKFDPNNGYKQGKRIAWNKGLTKETDERIKKSGQMYSKNNKGKKRKPLSKNHKKSISNSMKKAHQEGKAWNIGKSRWNNKPSYPEKWFMDVINNEFIDKNYIREYPFFIYSLDFAWINKKKCIEIDGEQHERFSSYKERDKRKDELLLNNGWKILRLKWIDIYNNPKYCIQTAKNFIDNN